MYQHFTPIDRFDRSPLQFFRINWLRERIRDVYETYMEYKRVNQGRVDSDHLLIKILTNITVPFNGDLIDYIDKVESQTRRIVGVLGITTNSTRGDLFTNVFYKDIPEIITVSRGKVEILDLWWNWRSVSPVTVHAHPVTSTAIFDPVVVNRPTLDTQDPYCLINIDIAILAAQWRMFKSNYPNGTYEQYISQIVVPAMMKSHLDIVLFNKVMVGLGLMTPCVVKSNLPFAQPDLDTPATKLAKEIIDGLLTKGLYPRQYLNSIPTLYSVSNSLEATAHPDMAVSQQSLWAIHSLQVMKANLVLEINKQRNHYDRSLPLIVRIKRDNVQLNQEGWYRNGLKTVSSQYLLRRFEGVLGRLPEQSMESSVDIWED